MPLNYTTIITNIQSTHRLFLIKITTPKTVIRIPTLFSSTTFQNFFHDLGLFSVVFSKDLCNSYIVIYIEIQQTFYIKLNSGFLQKFHSNL